MSGPVPGRDYSLTKKAMAERTLDYLGVGDRAVSGAKPFFRSDLVLLMDELRPEMETDDLTTNEMRHHIAEAAVENYDGYFATEKCSAYSFRIHEVRDIYYAVIEDQ